VCGLSSKQKTAAGEAVAALRKIHAATEVGVNYQQYGMLVIDAKDKVNNANAVLPDGEMKSRLNAAIDAYTDASQAWGIKVSGNNLLKPDTEPGVTLMRKYNLKTQSLKVGSRDLLWLDADETRQAAWGAAWGHLLVAQKLLEGQ
jgi:hypothetical protein